MEGKDFKYGKQGKKPGKYPPEIKEQAVAMFQRTLPDFKTRSECAGHVCDLLGVGCSDTLLKWVKQAEADSGNAQGAPSAELEEIRRLKRENAELKRANGILKAASAFFAAELDRPQAR
jgi:transposase